MESKSDRVRRLVAAGQFKEALRIAKGFRRGITKSDSDAMRRGYECLATSPDFYRSLGVDVEECILKGTEVLVRLYG